MFSFVPYVLNLHSITQLCVLCAFSVFSAVKHTQQTNDFTKFASMRTIKNRPFWLLTFAAIFILVVSQLIQDGAFMDGMLYVSVSKNLHDGIGTFWDPHFCKFYQSSFHEQPPLYFGLLAVFYKVFGTSLYVERFFCFCCFALTAVYIHKLWKKITSVYPDVAANSWLPVFYWTIIPICFWAYTNLVEEVVMSMFVVIALYYSFVALFLNQRTILNLALAGIFIFLSFLTKGIQGVFPVAAAGAYWLVNRKNSFSKMLLHSLILLGVPVLIYFVIVSTNSAAAMSFHHYFYDRVLGTFTNKNATTGNRFFLLGMLVSHLLPIAVISILLRFAFKKTSTEHPAKNKFNAVIVWLLLIGLAGSLPLMITLEQRTFYLVTSMPFFALAIALWSEPFLAGIIDKLNTGTKKMKAITIASWLILLASLVFSGMQTGKAKRDGAMLEDVYAFGKIIPHSEIVGMPSSMCTEFNFKEYFIRYYYINLDDTDTRNSHQYYICRKGEPKSMLPANFRLYPAQTKEFDLYIRN
ncbi:MAG: hypothetical protein JWP12_366 [Bacteroidetes bacterium]|nr:hypothetical protein [Bacteroidota bacterium]